KGGFPPLFRPFIGPLFPEPPRRLTRLQPRPEIGHQLRRGFFRRETVPRFPFRPQVVHPSRMRPFRPRAGQPFLDHVYSDKPQNSTGGVSREARLVASLTGTNFDENKRSTDRRRAPCRWTVWRFAPLCMNFRPGRAP